MLEHLFGSKTRLRLLRAFFRQPDGSFYVRELSRLLEAQINAVRRELETLLKTGLIKETSDYSGDETMQGSSLRKYYTLNVDSALYTEMQALLLKDQILGKETFIDEIKNRGGAVKLFILTGHFTGDPSAPSDLLLVGDLKPQAVGRIIRRHEKEFGFEVRYTLMTAREFYDRRRIMDKFLYALFEAHHLKVVDALAI